MLGVKIQPRSDRNLEARGRLEGKLLAVIALGSRRALRSSNWTIVTNEELAAVAKEPAAPHFYAC